MLLLSPFFYQIISFHVLLIKYEIKIALGQQYLIKKMLQIIQVKCPILTTKFSAIENNSFVFSFFDTKRSEKLSTFPLPLKYIYKLNSLNTILKNPRQANIFRSLFCYHWCSSGLYLGSFLVHYNNSYF